MITKRDLIGGAIFLFLITITVIGLAFFIPSQRPIYGICVDTYESIDAGSQVISVTPAKLNDGILSCDTGKFINVEIQ